MIRLLLPLASGATARLASGAAAARPLASGATAVPPLASAAAPPHVVFVIADDLGYDDLGFRNGGQVHTPKLDEMARSGVEFGNNYVESVCSPSRASLLSGAYSGRAVLSPVWLCVQQEDASRSPTPQKALKAVSVASRGGAAGTIAREPRRGRGAQTIR